MVNFARHLLALGSFSSYSLSPGLAPPSSFQTYWDIRECHFRTVQGIDDVPGSGSEW